MRDVADEAAGRRMPAGHASDRVNRSRPPDRATNCIKVWLKKCFSEEIGILIEL